MPRSVLRFASFFLSILITIGIVLPAAQAVDSESDAVSAVSAQLNAIDSLQTMQEKRSEYPVKSSSDTGTTDTSILSQHEEKRSQYEAYVAKMLSARVAARQAFDSLSPEEQSQIDPALIAKLNDSLSTQFHSESIPVTPRKDEYHFQAVNGGFGYAYEVSNHMVTRNIPQTFILVDTSDGKTSWTPSGKYVSGESNYDVLYCSDIETPLAYGSYYKRLNLEDSGYYGPNAASHIRAILLNSYPYISLEEMKSRLKADGLSADFVDNLSRSDIISAVQMAVWSFANAGDLGKESLGYFASFDITKNIGIYFTPLHDHNNECWDWLPGKRQRSYDARAEYRVNNLAYHLCSLDGVAPSNAQIVISDVKITRADLFQNSNGTYDIGMYVYLNNSGTKQDNLTVSVSSYTKNADGTVSLTGRTAQTVGGQPRLSLSVRANAGDTIRVTVEGTQTLEKGVYFYEPEGGREVSQCLVGVSEGKTYVSAEKTFEFHKPIDGTGLRIYKTIAETGLPLSDITFNIYQVSPEADEILNDAPTKEELERFTQESNKIGSITTDATGYAELALTEGIYLVEEVFNASKVKEPVSPFYVYIPMIIDEKAEDGTSSIKTINIVSVYPKNTPQNPPEDPPIIPPTPDNVMGKLTLLKHDEEDHSIVLKNARFAVYQLATESDDDTETLTCEGVQYVVTPVLINDEPLVLTTDENGYASSPEMECGVYLLKEIQAPSGYNLKEDAVSVTVLSNLVNTSAPVEIANKKGNLLPETGGIGIAHLLPIGSILTIGAAVLLVTQRRFNKSTKK